MTAVLYSDAASRIYNEYTLRWLQGTTYVSYSKDFPPHPAELYKDPLSIWIEMPDGSHANDQVTTGRTLYLKASIKLLTNWLSAYTKQDVPLVWGQLGADVTFEFQIFENYQSTPGTGINVGDTIYLWSLVTQPQNAQWVGVSPDYLQLYSGPSPFIIDAAS